MAPLRYDPDRAPHSTNWLESDESERLDAAKRSHRRPPEWHPPFESIEMHAALHVVVENQIAAGTPPDAAVALARLMQEGLSRHEALHGIGTLVAGLMAGFAKVEDYERLLQRIDAQLVALGLQILTPEYVDHAKTLFVPGDDLPDSVRTRLLALPAKELLFVLQIVGSSDELAYEDAPGAGFAPLHAIDLLGEMKSPEAAEVLLDFLETFEPGEDMRYDRSVFALKIAGPAALEPGLSRLEAGADSGGILEALAEIGVRDERLYERLTEHLHENPLLGAIALSEYGDIRALPLLSEMFDRVLGQPRRTIDPIIVREVANAIEQLGGSLTEDQSARFDAMNAAIYGAPGQQPIRKESKLGRNDPCHCGSGKKYKKCHLDADETTRH